MTWSHSSSNFAASVPKTASSEAIATRRFASKEVEDEQTHSEVDHQSDDVVRRRDEGSGGKGGVDDLRKVIHYAQILIEKELDGEGKWKTD